MARVLVVAVPRSARRNLEIGLDKGIWGFPLAPHIPDRVPDYRRIQRDDQLLLATGYTGGSPRRRPEAFLRDEATGTVNEFEEGYLCRVNQPYYVGTSPFWPDEFAASRVIYPHRIGIDPTPAGRISLEPGVHLSTDAVEALRLSLMWSSLGYLIDSAGSPLLDDGVVRPSDPGNEPALGGQGVAPDADRRRAIEDRAVEVAKRWYRTNGWSFEDRSLRNPDTYGTPYDLECRKGDDVRHVEVKGTTRAGAVVLLSANERRHAEDPNKAAESYLFVVDGIGLKDVRAGVKGTGGRVSYHGPLDTDPSRFTATQYRYTVP